MRLIARLDIKGENLIKGLQFEGLRILRDPNKYDLKYYKSGIDEILNSSYMFLPGVGQFVKAAEILKKKNSRNLFGNATII